MELSITLIAHSKGLGRYRLEDQTTGFVLNFLNPKSFVYHLANQLKMNKKEQKRVISELDKTGKCKLAFVKAA